MITCKGCRSRWTGQSRAHCATCHLTFAGCAYFDAHRKYNKCREPAGMGLTLNDKGVWFDNTPDSRYTKP